MAKEDPREDGPSLELPSLGFGRKRRKKAPEAASEPTAPVPETHSEPEREPAPEPTLEPEPVPAEPDAAPAPPLPADEVEAQTESAPAAGKRARKSRKTKPRRELPAINAMVAAVVTGLLIGVFTVGLTWGSLRLCEVAKGTSSCGGPGLLLLVAILIAMILLGSLMLRVVGVPDPGSTSFLAVGLLAVLVLLFLVDMLFNWWMIIVIPVFAAATFALSHWVTTAFVEPADL